MSDDLVRPTTETARVIDAVADGDLSQKMELKIDGRPLRGEHAERYEELDGSERLYRRIT